jgi:hypothetical protein
MIRSLNWIRRDEEYFANHQKAHSLICGQGRIDYSFLYVETCEFAVQAARIAGFPGTIGTAPAQECPTNTTGPSCSAEARLTVATSLSSEVNESCTATTCSPFVSRRGITLSQLEPSAQAPWTRTTFFATCFESVWVTAPIVSAIAIENPAIAA